MLMLILWTWRLATLVQGVAAMRLLRRKLTHEYGCLLAYLIASIIQSAVMMSSAPAFRMVFYSVTTPVMMLFRACLVIEVFRNLTAAYQKVSPKSRTFGTAMLASFAGVGVIASLIEFALGPSPLYLLHGAVVLGRLCIVAMTVVMALTWAFLAMTSDIPIPQTAARASAIIAIQFISEVSIYSEVLNGKFGAYSISGLSPVILCLLVSAMWATWFIAANPTRPEFRIVPLDPEMMEGRNRELAARIKESIDKMAELLND